jgi:hypothetical protein
MDMSVRITLTIRIVAKRAIEIFLCDNTQILIFEFKYSQMDLNILVVGLLNR